MRLAPGEVHLWTLRLDRDLERGGEAFLDRDERDRAARFRVAGARRRFEHRRVGLRRILARYLDVDPAAVVVDRTCARCGHPAHGKPRLPPGGPSFSTAASGAMAVVALAQDLELGVDLVSPAAVESALAGGLPDSLMTAAEHEAVAAGALRLEELWVRKEALAKGIGTGLVADATDLDTIDPPGDWLLQDLPRIQGCRGALAANGGVRSLLVRGWE